MENVKSEVIHPKCIALLEAVLFAFGEPITIKKLSQKLALSVDEIRSEIIAMQMLYTQDEHRGIEIIFHNDEVQLVTKKSYRGAVETFVEDERESELTPAARETLAIIAYSGPVARSRIDYLRGVNSAFIIRSLLMRGLIEKQGTKGSASLYGATIALLRHMGSSKKEELPDFETFQKLLSDADIVAPNS